ncbi:GntR family transcriptional regulator [Pacificimonas sp. ICDLI1SI03]
MRKAREEAGGVDRLQAVPLYHQIFLQLREEITSGERSFGSRLPTEEELSAQFGVSRITTRRALDELADSGFVERRRRVGTTVIFRSPAKPLHGDIHQALDSLLSFGRSTQVKLLDSQKIPAPAPIHEALEIDLGTPIFKIVRVRWQDKSPLGHFTSFIPFDLGADMTEEKINSTPMLTLIEQAGASIGAAHQTISATLADATLSAALQVEIGSPILRVSRTVLDTGKRPVQHVLAHFRSDKYQIRLDLGSAEEGAKLL